MLFQTNSTESILTSETSPDGRSLAFITTSNSAYLRVLDVNGAGEPRTLLALKGPERFQEWPGGLTWSRDSKFVLFSKGTNQQELWRVRVEGGSPEPLGLTGKTSIFCGCTLTGNGYSSWREILTQPRPTKSGR